MKLVQRVVLIDATGHISDKVIRDVASAINHQVQHEFRDIWGINAEVTALDHPGLLEPGMWPVFIVSETLDESAGFHKFSHGQPYAEVTEADGYDWSIAASHEVLEMLVDPSGSRLVPGRGITLQEGQVEDTSETVGYLLEICDPSEHPDCAYSTLRVKKENGEDEDILVSDFYTPSFFEEGPRSGVSYTHKDMLTAPRRVRAGGYLTWWDPGKRKMRQLDYTGGELRLNTLPPHRPHMSLREQSDQNTRNRVCLVRQRPQAQFPGIA